MKTMKVIELILLVCVVAILGSKSKASDDTLAVKKKVVSIDFTQNEVEYRDIIFDDSEALEVHIDKSESKKD